MLRRKLGTNERRKEQRGSKREWKAGRKEKWSARGKKKKEKRERKKERKKRRKDLLVFILVNLFGEKDSFSYGRHIRYINREGVEVVSYNTKLDNI